MGNLRPVQKCKLKLHNKHLVSDINNLHTIQKIVVNLESILSQHLLQIASFGFFLFNIVIDETPNYMAILPILYVPNLHLYIFPCFKAPSICI